MKPLVLLSGLCLLAACSADVSAPPASSQAAAEPLLLPLPSGTQADIRAEDLAIRIKTLADDTFEGRGPGTPAGEAAAAWIAAEMDRIGLQPGGIGGSWYQPVTMVNQTVDATQSSLSVTWPDGTVEAMPAGETAVFWTKRQNTNEVTFEAAPVVFVGYGAVAPEYGWNDYAGLDARGKTVVMLVNDPGFATGDPELFNGRAMTYYGRWTYKFEEAARQGATAAIVIHETEPASYGWDVVANSWSGAQSDLVRSNGGEDRALLEGWITRDMAARMFARAGLDFEAMKAAAKTPGFQPVALEGVAFNGTIRQSIEQLQSRNVIGIHPGTTAPDKYFLYTAHWDHLA